MMLRDRVEFYIRTMIEIAATSADGDTEAAHADADELLCEFIKELGYNELVDAFNSVKKWYA